MIQRAFFFFLQKPHKWGLSEIVQIIMKLIPFFCVAWIRTEGIDHFKTGWWKEFHANSLSDGYILSIIITWTENFQEK